MNVTIQAASIDTTERDRDTHLPIGRLLRGREVPDADVQERARSRGRATDGFDVAGDLTIHGVTRPVTFDVTFLGKAKDPWGNERIAFEAETTINRKDYGLLWNAALETGGFLVGDEVKISLSVQAMPNPRRRSGQGVIRQPRVRGDRCPCAPRSGGTRCSGSTGRVTSRTAATLHRNDRPGTASACVPEWAAVRR